LTWLSASDINPHDDKPYFREIDTPRGSGSEEYLPAQERKVFSASHGDLLSVDLDAKARISCLWRALATAAPQPGSFLFDASIRM
jgi:hypothetical protein